MKVSVIIPVYNTEVYLRECLDSVLAQSCEDLEILLINDGSQDGSGAICDAYAARYPNIRVICQEHRGPGSARNEGLRRAAGEYIVFADADDYLPSHDSIQKLTDLLETSGADIAVGNYCRLWDGRTLEAAGHSAFHHMDPGSGNFRFCGFFSVGHLSYVWAKVYRRSFLTEQGLFFGSYEYAEDKAFNAQCYLRGARYAFLDNVVYTYRKNNASVSHLHQRERAECWLQIASDLLQYLENNDCASEYGDLVAYIVNFAAFFDAKSQYCRSEKRVTAVRELLGKYASDPVAYRCFRQLSSGQFLEAAYGIGWKVMMWTFAFLMRVKALGILSFGIKLMVDWKIDEQLSDTGRKRSN